MAKRVSLRKRQNEAAAKITATEQIATIAAKRKAYLDRRHEREAVKLTSEDDQSICILNDPNAKFFWIVIAYNKYSRTHHYRIAHQKRFKVQANLLHEAKNMVNRVMLDNTKKYKDFYISSTTRTDTGKIFNEMVQECTNEKHRNTLAKIKSGELPDFSKTPALAS